MKLLVQEREDSTATHMRYLYTTDLSLSGEEVWRMRWEIEELQGTSRPWDSSFWRREKLKGYLTIFTINNVIRELVGEPNLRSVQTFPRSSNVIWADHLG